MRETIYQGARTRLTGPKPRSVLLSNWELLCWGGTETWVWTLVNAFTRWGVPVVVFCPGGQGEPARQYTAMGATVFGDVDALRNTCARAGLLPFDLAILNHHVCQEPLRTVLTRFRIHMCHGSIPQEVPAPGADLFGTVSREMYQHVTRLGRAPAAIFTQPIDLRTFHPGAGIAQREQLSPRKVLLLSNVSEHVARVEEATKRLGMKFERVGGAVRLDPPGVAERIRQNDIVVSVGRGVREALCCGRRVVVANINRMDGAVVDEGAFRCFRICNCAGRSKLNRDTTVANLMDSLEWVCKADEEELKRVTKLVRAECGVDNWVRKEAALALRGNRRRSTS